MVRQGTHDEALDMDKALEYQLLDYGHKAKRLAIRISKLD